MNNLEISQEKSTHASPWDLTVCLISLLVSSWRRREHAPVKMQKRLHWGDAVDTLEDRATVQRT